MQQRIRELEAQIAQNSTSQATPSIPNESIHRSRNASKTSMQAIRAKLGYDKTRWNSFWSYCRDAATSARLNWDGNWKSQRSEKLSMAYNAIEAAFPETALTSLRPSAARKLRPVSRFHLPHFSRLSHARPIPSPPFQSPKQDNEDEFVAASDHEAPRDEQDEDEREEEDDGGMSEMAKGKRKASEQGGKDPKQARRR
ncbi:hypothetical protein K438DRAFT_1982414 [Mycena galopus ATCC 62051]|nr:hypothetical protein K438DRAFT_1982414 [Mycena galopus ATCC 62051]